MIGIILCFKKNTFTSGDIITIHGSASILGFTPKKLTSFTHGLNGVRYEPSKHLKVLQRMDKLGFSFESEAYTGPKFSTYDMKSFQMLRWEVNLEALSEIDLSAFYKKEGFSVGYCFDLDYVSWQSEKSLSVYEYWNKPHAHLQTFYDKSLEMYTVDISNNPGRMTQVNGFWLISCWRMYFGFPFFQYIPKETLLSFDGAKSIQEVAQDVVFIELYDDVYKSDKNENQQLQRSFRDWIGMDDLEKKLV